METSDSEVAKLLFPELKTSNVFIGMVKTEAERYTAYGKLAAVCCKTFLVIMFDLLLRWFCCDVLSKLWVTSLMWFMQRDLTIWRRY